MTESIETTCTGKSPFATKVRTLAIGALATAALSISAVSALGVVSHDAAKVPSRPQPVRISPDSHRLAMTVKPASVRLT